MDAVGGEVTCRRGDMWLSQVMRTELEAIVHEPAGRQEATTHLWGGRWYCPADGEPMVKEDGVVQCAACGRWLPGRVLYGLIELHPHTKG